jgi:hypothetical protein
MIDDMTARRYSEKVQKAYVRHVRAFAAFLGRSPHTATSDDLPRFQLHMAQQQISAEALRVNPCPDDRSDPGLASVRGRHRPAPEARRFNHVQRLTCVPGSGSVRARRALKPA